MMLTRAYEVAGARPVSSTTLAEMRLWLVLCCRRNVGNLQAVVATNYLIMKKSAV